MCKNSNTAASTPKRKRDSIALGIIDDMRSRVSVKLSPETIKMKNKLFQKALRAVDDPEIDQDDLLDSWKMLSKLMDSRVVADKLTRQLDKSEKDLKDFNFHMRIGDWVHGIHDRTRGAETDFMKTYVDRLQKAYISSGIPGPKAHKLAMEYKSFHVAKGFRVSDTLALIQPELDRIEQWRAEGEKEGEAPPTPYLDRVKALCDIIGINRGHYLDLIRIADKRNTLAHSAPSLEDYFRTDGTINWREVRKACAKTKKLAKKHFKKGKLTDEQHGAFTGAVDTWLKAHVSSWTKHDEPQLAAGVEKSISGAVERRKARDTKLSSKVPDSPWEKGKWDDID
ncbi:hypothetical protein N0V84_000462 [Fusarium piperis]|uniref:Uncharacterized protein n=1 Tax=Fusarium piperis TaxID=1435070 RepID=A0A9W9BTZ7_9HYPO|nr:hypothetical protein N0V84_000462 [Fusarium piperis]